MGTFTNGSLGSSGNGSSVAGAHLSKNIHIDGHRTQPATTHLFSKLVSNIVERFYDGRVKQVWPVLLFSQHGFADEPALGDAWRVGCGSRLMLSSGTVLVSMRYVNQDTNEERLNEQKSSGTRVVAEVTI